MGIILYYIKYVIILISISSICFSIEKEDLMKSKKMIHKVIEGNLDSYRIVKNRNSTLEEIGKNIVLSVYIKSRRNNFEQDILFSFQLISQALKEYSSLFENNNEKYFSPSIITLECLVPQSRKDHYITSSISKNILTEFSNNNTPVKQFWETINKSLSISADFSSYSLTPSNFLKDINYENMIAARIAYEGKNNPKLKNILEFAVKSSWIPGVESKLESMLIAYLKSNYIPLMTEVLEVKPTEKQMISIGKQFFSYIQMPLEDIRRSHTYDSLQYVWKENKYPEILNTYYKNYNKTK